MNSVRIFLVCLLSSLRLLGFAQDNSIPTDSLAPKSKKTELKGYLSNLISPQYNNFQGDWKTTNYLHQRLNFRWIPSTHFCFTAQLRSRFNYNQSGVDTTYFNVYDGFVQETKKQFFNSSFDRLNLKYTNDKFEVTVGRQRINWGQSFVWNPNDLFNSYSFFDFDYIERPGSDAIRLQYYNSYTSSAELALKIDRNDKITFAGLYRFNHSGFDYQILGGVLSSEDAVIGAGTTGNIQSVSIFGEGTYFRPIKNFADTTGMVMIDIGCSKMFSNNISLQLEGLFVSNKVNINSFFNLLQSTMDVRKIAFAQINLFGSISYPITPLINGSIALMWFPGKDGISGIYTGPSLDFSLGNNLTLSAIAQYFKGKYPDSVVLNLQDQTLLLSFARLKWNF
jgi:hypothetical protein